MQPWARTLTASLRQQEHELHQLEGALEMERELLCSGAPDGEGLLQAAEAKSAQLSKLKKIEEALDALQVSQGYDPGRNGRTEAATAAGCAELLERLRAKTSRVYWLNGANGEVLKQRMKLNEKILSFMREAQGAVIYGASGKTRAQQSTISSHA